MGAVTRNELADALPYDRVVVMAIGVEDYQNAPGRPKMKQVHHARADAAGFIETIRQVYDGLAEVDSHALIDGHASLSTIDDEIDYVIARLSPNDLFIFYYAGHGCQIEGANRLTAWDSNPSLLGESTIDLDEDVIAKIKASQCSRALLFIDACAEAMKAIAPSRSLIFDLNEAEIEEKLEGDDYLAVYLSCSDGEKSYGADPLGHGVFTWHLLRALRGEDPRALERDRWMTDVSLRDWLVEEVPAYITANMNIRGHQTPRAILSAPRTFRIRHVPPPPATAATTLADLGLGNSDVYLEGTETGAIKSLAGFKKGYHRVPTDHNDAAVSWIGRLLGERLQQELDDLFSNAKQALGFKRRQGEVSVAGGEGGVDTPAFRYSMLCDQDPDDPAGWRIRRRLELRDGWEEQRDEIEDAIAGLDLDRFVVTFDNRHELHEQVADALEALAEHDGDFNERRAERKLIYTRGAMSIVFDFQAGEVEFSVRGESNLELVESTRAISLGWTRPSPMLASAPAPALTDRSHEAQTRRKTKNPPPRG